MSSLDARLFFLRMLTYSHSNGSSHAHAACRSLSSPSAFFGASSLVIHVVCFLFLLSSILSFCLLCLPVLVRTFHSRNFIEKGRTTAWAGKAVRWSALLTQTTNKEMGGCAPLLTRILNNTKHPKANYHQNPRRIRAFQI